MTAKSQVQDVSAGTAPDGGLVEILGAFDQLHALRFWDSLGDQTRNALTAELCAIDFNLVQGLVDQWILGSPSNRAFSRIEPAEVYGPYDSRDPASQEAASIGAKALSDGRVGFLLVAGGQGTRLGFDGPKGSFPAGPITRRSLFAYFADRIQAVARRYGVRPPWYIMVGNQNEEVTKSFFREHGYFGIDAEQIHFFTQGTMPGVDERGRLLLDTPGTLATNPNGHGGVIPGFVRSGLLADADSRGVDTLHYFQVDNYAVRLDDPYFLGLHIQNAAEFSSKVCRKLDLREAAGIFCVCDGRTRVIEYTELDLYPQLLEVDSHGHPVHFAANTAIHALSTGFIERVDEHFDRFPWHCSHKKIGYVTENGERVEPAAPNGYKFETFIFDSLEYCERPPVLLEIPRDGEFAPIKQMEGPGGLGEARESMRRYWHDWFKAAGLDVPASVDIEISPRFASSKEEFVEKAPGFKWKFTGPISIGPNGEQDWRG